MSRILNPSRVINYPGERLFTGPILSTSTCGNAAPIEFHLVGKRTFVSFPQTKPLLVQKVNGDRCLWYLWHNLCWSVAEPTPLWTQTTHPCSVASTCCPFPSPPPSYLCWWVFFGLPVVQVDSFFLISVHCQNVFCDCHKAVYAGGTLVPPVGLPNRIVLLSCSFIHKFLGVFPGTEWNLLPNRYAL